MKNKILVPTDFSPAALNAYLYALNLANKYKASIELINVYDGTFSLNQPTKFRAGMTREEAILADLNQFSQMGEEAGDFWSTVEVSTKAIQGIVVPNMIRKSKDPETLMIVMGLTGGGIAEKIIGSVSSEVAQKAKCPVLLIPKTHQYKAINSILYAANFESAEIAVVQQIDNFANLLNSIIHFVHVDDQKSKEDFSDAEDQIFNTLFKDGFPEYPFLMSSIRSDSVIQGLNGYADKHNIDLIALVNRQRSFFESITGQSMTRKMSLAAKFPLLVFHID